MFFFRIRFAYKHFRHIQIYWHLEYFKCDINISFPTTLVECKTNHAFHAFLCFTSFLFFIIFHPGLLLNHETLSFLICARLHNLVHILRPRNRYEQGFYIILKLGTHFYLRDLTKHNVMTKASFTDPRASSLMLQFHFLLAVP